LAVTWTSISVSFGQTGFNLKTCICALLNSYKKSGKHAAQQQEVEAKPDLLYASSGKQQTSIILLSYA
jgi:hypothetical protein